MVQSVNLHLLIDGTCHDITWSQRQTLVIFLHEALAIRQTQDAAIATHSLRNQEGRMCLAWRVERCGVKLHKLHVGHRTLGTIDHSLTITSSDDRIRGGLIHSTTTACTHQRDLRQISIHLLRIRVQHISTVTVDIGCATCHLGTQMMLGDNLHCEVVLSHHDIRIASHGSHQSALNLSTSIISMVQDTELRVSALTMQVKRTVFLAVEVDAPLHQFLDLFRSVSHHLLYCSAITDIVACYHRVFDMLVEIINSQIGNRSHATLCK